MDRRTFLRMGFCTAAGAVAGIALNLILPDMALARGSTPDEAARAQGILSRFAVQGKGRPDMTKNGIITLAPGEVLTFECEGFCLDLDLAVPSEDDPMAFRPMTKYLAPEERQAYVALMRRAGASRSDDMGGIVHRMRNPKPGRPLQYAHGESFPALWASQRMPSQSFRYSMLRSDGVAGMANGDGGLHVRCVIANGSPKPFVFDPTQWVLESPRDVQAIALPVPRTYYVAKGKNMTGGQQPSSPADVPQAQPSTRSPQPQKNAPDKNGFVGF